MDEHEEAKNSQDQIFQLRIIIHDNGHHSNVRKKAKIVREHRIERRKIVRDSPFRSADDILSLQPQLSGRVEAAIVDVVVITFGQKLHITIISSGSEVNDAQISFPVELKA